MNKAGSLCHCWGNMNFKQGIRDGIPIGLGYAAVSFAFGILAVDKDLTVSEAVLISFTNLTSAGQFAGLTIIAELGTLVEMALSQFIINLRYMLMAISLSQKVDDDFQESGDGYSALLLPMKSLL